MIPKTTSYSKGQKISYDYGSEFDGPDSWKIVRADHTFIGTTTRYTITNGVTTISGCRPKDFS